MTKRSGRVATPMPHPPKKQHDQDTTSVVNKLKTHQGTYTKSTPIKECNDSKVILDHAHKVLDGLEDLWRQNTMCNVTLVVGNWRTRAHKVVLASCAEYFRELMDNVTTDNNRNLDMEITLDGISRETLETILECMYTGRIKVNENNVQELLTAAAFIKFPAIKEECAEHLTQTLNVRNCLRILDIASSYDLQNLTETALRVSAMNFMEISESTEFQKLNIAQILALLSRDDLVANTELDVFNGALFWIDLDRRSRLKHAADILEKVRLPLLAPSVVIDHVETVDYLMKIPECQQLVKDTLHYHCLPARQSILQTSRTVPRSTLKTKVLLATGGAPRLKSEHVSDDVMMYNPLNDTWRHLTRMKNARHHHAVTVLGGFLYVAGGEHTNDQKSPLRSCWRYDPRTNQWLRLADMKHCRESFQLAVLNSMIYAVGGRIDEDVSLASVERYDPAVDEWVSVASLSAPRRSVAVATFAGRLYAVGGSGQRRISSRVERYNPHANQWETRRSLANPRFFAQLCVMGTRMFLCGGATIDSSGNVVCIQDVDCYSPMTDTWTTVSRMLEPRAESGCAVLNGKIYMVGGYSWNKGVRLQSTEVYDPESNTWSEAPPIHTPYTGVACCPITIYSQPIHRALDPGLIGAHTLAGIKRASVGAHDEDNEDAHSNSDNSDKIDGKNSSKSSFMRQSMYGNVTCQVNGFLDSLQAASESAVNTEESSKSACASTDKSHLEAIQE